MTTTNTQHTEADERDLLVNALANITACETQLRQQRDALAEALRRIAAYDAPDAHAMIEQARAALAKMEGK